MRGLGYFRFARRYSGNVPPFGGFFYFPPGTEMFHFPGYAPYYVRSMLITAKEFPHSEISGSKVARHLPEAYRSHTTSFIAS